MKKRRVAIMTGGGDAPGLNGIIESCCTTLLKADFEVVGILDGFEGIIFNRHRLLNLKELYGAHCLSGTLLGTSNKFGISGREIEFLKQYEALDIEGMIVAGGDGTFSGLQKVSQSLKILGVPKTIDNDLSGTDITFGYDTACSVVAESVDALRATAEAHRRVIIVETMGRTAGWIALGGGLASYADAILIPERPFALDDLVEHLKEQLKAKRGLVVVVSEGACTLGSTATISHTVTGSPQAERFGGIAQKLARQLEPEIGTECRQVVLGHLQRARQPTTTDRFLTLAMGVEIAQLAIENQWGQAAVYRNGQVARAPITDLMGPARLVPSHHRWVNLAHSLGIFI